MEKLIRITPLDNVAVAVGPFFKGDIVSFDGVTYTLLSDLPAGHKMALRDIKAGEKVIKYGYPIGEATVDIHAGSHVHSFNIRTLLSEEAGYSYDEAKAAEYIMEAKEREQRWQGKVPTIMAYERANGDIGIRNELWIVPTVGCVNRIGERLCTWARENLGMKDGVHVWTHPFGCSQLGDDHENTRKILAGLVHHPNAGGVLVLSLGCENNTPESFRELLGQVDEERVRFLTCQKVEDEFEEGCRLLSQIADVMKHDVRTSVSMSHLRVGFKCGGSDGFSGITANPLVGRFCDELTAMGGTAVLTEVPEMFGAEQVLMDRAADRKVFEEIVAMVNGFKHYFTSHGQVVYENPSPGNKAGGISTLEDKSLGCVQKGGRSVVTAVAGYGDKIDKPGLTLLTGPGNDIVSTTVQSASGVHLILFTTGRGTPLGAPVPTVKIATNSALAKNKSGWIDFDAGRILDGDAASLTNDLLQYIVKLASGEVRTKNEVNGYAEISIFKDGVVL